MLDTGCMRAFITASRRSAVTMSSRRESMVIRDRRGGLQHLVAREHQFAHQVHHAVEQGDIHAQGAFAAELPGTAAEEGAPGGLANALAGKREAVRRRLSFRTRVASFQWDRRWSRRGARILARRREQ